MVDDEGAPTRLVVVGQGYVGLPLAVRAVDCGFDVVGFDLDEPRVRALAAGQSFIEDITDAQVAAALASGRYTPTDDAQACEAFDVAVITVPTPLNDGTPDLTFVEAAARTLGKFLSHGATVILESTTYPGTTEELVVPLLANGSGLIPGTDFSVGFSPERIDPGNPEWGLVNTPKIVSGIDASSLAAVQGFYDRLVDQTVTVRSPKEAELAKLLENTFRHVNIALVNEVAMYAHDLGIDIWNVIDAASTKPFGFMRFTPGPGVGGHCLPIDPSYLSWRVKRSLGHNFRFVELANDVNEHMPDYIVLRLTHTLNDQGRSIRGARLLLLGLAYKRNSSDARESPAVKVAERLVRLGGDVRCADPHVAPHAVPAGATLVEATREELRAADVVILLTDHDAFDYDAVVSESHHVFDVRNRVDGAVVHHL
jgi:UDP-N-acetyl-D-glucosamine dehydrogenase